MDPALSIIVCTYNREKYIGKCLQHLLNQTAEKGLYEVIIVNNNSTDGTDKICRDFISNNKLGNFRYVIEGKQGLSNSRNRGIKECASQILSFIDDDAFADISFAQNVIDFFNLNKEVLAIGGKIIPIFEGKRPSWLSPYLMPLVSAIDLGDKSKPFKGRKFPIGANMSFRKEAFSRFGVFNVALGRSGNSLEGGEEKDFFSRIKSAKGLVFYCPGAVVQHIIPGHRLETDYIQRLAEGVARSERTRLDGLSIKFKLLKLINELVKIGGTFILSVAYYVRFAPAKANMLLKFRYWVISGYFKRQ